jgi:hypothetical protein
LHSSVINNHVVESDTVVLVFLGNVAASAQEQTISKFPLGKREFSYKPKTKQKNSIVVFYTPM